jgi:hypothetical protein
MTVQYSILVRNAMLDAIEVATGAAPRLRFYTGTQPANCAAAATGTLLVDMTLPADWMANAASGAKALTGAWSATGAAVPGTGTAGYYRIWDAAVTNCHEQGSIAQTTGGDINLDNASIVAGQTVNIISKNITAGNA